MPRTLETSGHVRNTSQVLGSDRDAFWAKQPQAAWCVRLLATSPEADQMRAQAIDVSVLSRRVGAAAFHPSACIG